MKFKNMILSCLLIVVVVFSMRGEIEEVSAYNKGIFDTQYSFDKAVIDLHSEVITVEVRSWMDYEDGEQLQIVAKDGTVYLTSSYNCTLIKSK